MSYLFGTKVQSNALNPHQSLLEYSSLVGVRTHNRSFEVLLKFSSSNSSALYPLYFVFISLENSFSIFNEVYKQKNYIPSVKYYFQKNLTSLKEEMMHRISKWFSFSQTSHIPRIAWSN